MDTYVKQTPRVGPSLYLLPLLDSLKRTLGVGPKGLGLRKS